MSIKEIFLFIKKNEQIDELKQKIIQLERELKEIKKQVNKKEEANPNEQPRTEPPIIIEKINIEKIILDKYELNNNFGQLGIKELQGQLNIGATYGRAFSPKKKTTTNHPKKEEQEHKAGANQSRKEPSVNIRPKQEE
jgi:hypothetical protein